MQQAAEIKVGIFVVAVVAIGVFVVSQLQGGLAGSARSYDFEIWFDNAPGVGVGSPVRLAGVDIGEVLRKDIMTVTEKVTFEPAPSDDVADVLPIVRRTIWAAGQRGDADYAEVDSDRRRLTMRQRQAQQEYTRERSIARLVVRVKQPFQMYQNYRYQIVGGVLFGDKQLEVSDVAADGMPMANEARGEPVAERRESGRRVAVLGGAPPDVDKIVGTVQDTIDEETSGKVKQIVGNIERATDEAAELILALRETVTDNQANTHQLMTNLAAASDAIKAGVAEARTATSRSLTNIERITATGQRVAENNEERLNRIVQDVQATSSSVARMARDGEPRVRATLDETQGIVREVREMIAANRANFDQAASRLAAAADQVAGITEDSRGRVATLLEQVNAAVADARGVLEQSDQQLQGILANANTASANVRDITGDLRTNLGPITENLTATSESLRAASGNVANLTGDERLTQILDNLNATATEARGMMQDVRQITGDQQIQQDIRQTTASVRSLTTSLDESLGSIASYRPRVYTDVYYVPDESRWQGNVSVDVLTRGPSSYHVGADDLTNDPRWSAMLGSRFRRWDNLRARYGFYRGKLGVGADWFIDPRASLFANVYDFEDPQVDLRFTYRLPWGLTGLVGVEDVFDTFDWTWGVRLGRDFP